MMMTRCHMMLRETGRNTSQAVEYAVSRLCNYRVTNMYMCVPLTTAEVVAQ